MKGEFISLQLLTLRQSLEPDLDVIVEWRSSVTYDFHGRKRATGSVMSDLMILNIQVLK